MPSTSRDFEAVVDAKALLLTLRTFRISLKMQAKVWLRTQFRIHKNQQGSKHKASGSARPSSGAVTWVIRWLLRSIPKDGKTHQLGGAPGIMDDPPALCGKKSRAGSSQIGEFNHGILYNHAK